MFYVSVSTNGLNEVVTCKITQVSLCKIVETDGNLSGLTSHFRKWSFCGILMSGNLPLLVFTRRMEFEKLSFY